MSFNEHTEQHEDDTLVQAMIAIDARLRLIAWLLAALVVAQLAADVAVVIIG